MDLFVFAPVFCISHAVAQNITAQRDALHGAYKGRGSCYVLEEKAMRSVLPLSLMNLHFIPWRVTLNVNTTFISFEENSTILLQFIWLLELWEK